tara:strand:+ start:22 stop:2955 length:2934 start_codon:yes stop_codon:yes gene_type:complete
MSVGKSLKVGNSYIGSDDKDASISDQYNVRENILVINHNESPTIGSSLAGFVVGGFATGPDPTSIDSSDGGDHDDAFVYDRPYWLHKNNMWRTKEGLWLEGKLLHKEVFTGLTGGPYGPTNQYVFGSTGGDYPYGPYGYTGETMDHSNPFFDGADDSAESGVVRIHFGPTLAGYNFLDIDGRGGRAGVTGHIWRGVGGKTGALVIGNTAGPVMDFDTDGFVNIYRGANKKRIVKGNHGFTFGNVIRYSGTTQGYTYASAAGANEPHGYFTRAAEAIGMVSNVVDHETFDLTFSGEITGTKAEWNATLREDHTEGLVPGHVYFLSTSTSPGDRGRIQHASPIVSGTVNKPMLLATGNTSGIILPYRGQYNSPTGCTGGSVGLDGASGDEKILFDQGYNTSEQTFNEGDIVALASDKNFASGLQLADNRNVSTSKVIGIVSYVDTTLGFIRIVTSGAVTFQEKVLDTGRGTHYLHENGQATTTPSGAFTVKVFDAISPTRIVVHIGEPEISTPVLGAGSHKRRGSEKSIPGMDLSIAGPTGATGFTYDNATHVNVNHIVNPDFGIWQRGVGVTGATGYVGNTNTYFADRWLRVSQTGTGPHSGNPFTGKSAGTHRTLDYALRRGSFDKKQTEVEGHPDYYAIVRGAITYPGGTNTNEWHRVEQRIPDCTSFAGEVMTVSFYAKGAATGDCAVAWLQNLTGTTGAAPGATFAGLYSSVAQTGKTASELVTPITTFRVGTGWERYAYAFFVPEISNEAGASAALSSIQTGVTADHFASLAFYTQWTSLPNGEHKNLYFDHDLSLAQVKLERGNISTPFNPVDPNEELRKCQRFYQTSYEYNIPPGTITLRGGQGNGTVADTTGVHFIVPGSMKHVHTFPIPMRKKPNSCRLFSPSGTPDEGFNKDVGKDMKYVAGTMSSLGSRRQTSGNSLNVGCTADSSLGVEISVKAGAEKLDSIAIHYEVDAEFNNAMPSSVDNSTAS